MADEERYIRCDQWCKCLRSCNAAYGKFEEGVSVYECIKVENGWKWTGSAAKKNSALLDNPSAKLWFLVKGTRLENKGGDREPLLMQIQMVKLLNHVGYGVFQEVEKSADYFRNHKGHPKCKCDPGFM